MTDDLKHIIESLLFVSDTPLSMAQLKNILEGTDGAAIRDAVDRLVAEYQQRDGGFVLKEVAGGFQFRTQRRYNDWIKRLVKPHAPRLSKPALETLAIIAYNQPIIRSDIEHIRGVDSGGVIRMLMERKLIRVLGRKEIPGRPLIYATTKHFLEVFELKDLKDLPTPKEIEELSKTRQDEAVEETDGMPPPEPETAQPQQAPADEAVGEPDGHPDGDPHAEPEGETEREPGPDPEPPNP